MEQQNIGQHKCGKCGTAFGSENELRNHERTHQSESERSGKPQQGAQNPQQGQQPGGPQRIGPGQEKPSEGTEGAQKEAQQGKR